VIPVENVVRSRSQTRLQAHAGGGVDPVEQLQQVGED
jgi:hypothetical protein